MLTQAALPNWRDLCRALLRTQPSDTCLAAPWHREGEVAGWLSGSAWSLALTALWRKRCVPRSPVTVWIPDFFCNAALVALRKTGVKLVFYPVTDEMAPDISAFQALAVADPPDLFALVHYFGRPAAAAVVHDFCVRHGAWLIEDAAHVLRPVAGIGTYGDFVLYSPHKHMPIPDGAVLVLRTNGPGHFAADMIASLGAPVGWPGQLRELQRQLDCSVNSGRLRATTWLIKRLLQKFGVRRWRRLTSPFAEPENTAAPSPIGLASPFQTGLAKRLLGPLLANLEAVAGQRHCHQLLWDAVLVNDKALCQTVSPGVRPLNQEWTPYLAAYRVAAGSAEVAYSRWQRRGLPVTTWPDLPPEVTLHRDRHAKAWLLRHSHLFLPVHQSLRMPEIARRPQAMSMQGDNIFFKDILEEAAWSDTLANLRTSHPYTSWAWGEYKSRMAWTVRRISICDNNANNVVGCFQLQQKKLGPVCILLIQGGIHLKHLSDNNYHEILQSFLLTYLAQATNTIVIINPQAGSPQAAELALLRNRFTPVVNRRMYTFVLDNVDNSIDGKALSKNWRHNLKRALNDTAMSARWVGDLAARAQSISHFETLYANLMTRKLFSSPFNLGLARDIIVANSDFKIIEAVVDGKVIATRIGFFCSDHALDFLAASSECAKSTYANYLLLWKMIEMARSSGKSYFDCGGIDPTGSMGVYNFKKGLGGRLVVNGPMWLHGSNAILRHVGRLGLSLTN